MSLLKRPNTKPVKNDDIWTNIKEASNLVITEISWDSLSTLKVDSDYKVKLQIQVLMSAKAKRPGTLYAVPAGWTR